MSAWIPLRESIDLPRERVGGKAHRLARLLRDGAPVPDGFVLPVDAQSNVAAAAAELRERAPNTERWILRSSSPLEDRPGQSAAGLFTSHEAAPRELEAVLRQVLASATSAPTQTLLAEQSPLAVLAQPWLRAQIWLTVEARAAQALQLEGWRRTPDGRETIPNPALDAVELRTQLSPLSRWFAAEPDWPASLLEVLHDGSQWWLLQKRPAPSSALPENASWRLDFEHCTRPLCPLLAALLDGGVPSPDSRLHQGRWYVREGELGEVDATQAKLALSQSRQKLLRLDGAIESLRERFARVGDDVALWRNGVDRWLRLHALYFERPTALLRAWLAAHPAPRGALAQSLAERRGREIAALGTERGANWQALLERYGHLSAWPWDGRGRSAWEEPELLAQFALHETEIGEVRSASLSAQIACHLEDDDEHLARLYAVFRLALRDIWQARVGSSADWESALELAPAELFALLERWDEAAYAIALADGRARAAAWAQAPELEASRATCIVPGKVRGPACVRQSALEGGPPPLGSILVVPAISPFDAVAFARIGGLAVEAPERLSHAVILAREHGIPTVIGLTGACERWHDAKEFELDATLGTLVSI